MTVIYSKENILESMTRHHCQSVEKVITNTYLFLSNHQELLFLINTVRFLENLISLQF